jgi:hypothetical protein
MRTNDTPNNILISYAFCKSKSSREVLAMYLNEAQRGRMNIMFDSGAFSAFRSGATMLLEDYCSFLTENSEHVEKYVMLDNIGNEEQTKRNFESMVSGGLRPMYVWTVKSQDEAFLKDALSVNADVCVAGGANTKGEWLIQRFQRVAKIGAGAAKIHGLAFVTFPKMLQCGLASVDSSSWEAGALRFGTMCYFVYDRGMKGFCRESFVSEIKKRNPIAVKFSNELRLTAKDVLTDANFVSVRGIPYYASVRAYMAMQKYRYRRGLRLFFASLMNKSQFRAIEWWNENWNSPNYQNFRKYMEG